MRINFTLIVTLFLSISTIFLMNSCVAPDVSCISMGADNPCLGPIEFLGQGEKNPMVLVFELPFEDHNGDLGKGRVELFINDRPSDIGGLDMQEIFHVNGLDYKTTQGRLRWSIELTPSSEGDNSGSEFKIGVRVRDKKELVSNLQEITLAL